MNRVGIFVSGAGGMERIGWRLGFGCFPSVFDGMGTAPRRNGHVHPCSLHWLPTPDGDLARHHGVSAYSRAQRPALPILFTALASHNREVLPKNQCTLNTFSGLDCR
jgi:hypothetical protein